VASSTQSQKRADVLIGGGGIVGLALAITLRRSLGPSFSVTVADPALAPPSGALRAPPSPASGEGIHSGNGRATAIVASARRLLTTIGVWERIEAQPILDMVITDSRLTDAVRHTFLTFAGDVEPGEPFGHMVENAPLIDALLQRARAEGVVLLPTAVADVDFASNGIEVALADGDEISARLLVAADGARSAIRERAGIAVHGWPYGQSAITATVAHERDHQGRAAEHFLPAGPFAVLPLTGRRSSLVWTEETREAERILALPDGEFHAELERRFGLHLGEIELVGARHVHSLGLWVARSFIAERLALVGDAAHVIHPIAGQGLNMGLKDVAALAEVVVDAARIGLDPGSLDVLERYQRWRRFDTMAMGLSTDWLNRLFSNQSDVLRLARDVGLGLVDRLPALKGFFIREAAGLVGEVPKLLRGEAL
jgi:2-octaprenyl-6-methoxyphenol hydroxylase